MSMISDLVLLQAVMQMSITALVRLLDLCSSGDQTDQIVVLVPDVQTEVMCSVSSSYKWTGQCNGSRKSENVFAAIHEKVITTYSIYLIT
jgi:hypothetical protein